MIAEDDEPIFIVAMRVSDVLKLASGENVEMSCDDCGEKVSVNETTFPRMHEFPEHRLICNRCVVPYLVEADPEDVKICAADEKLQPILDENPGGTARWLIEKDWDKD